MTHGVRNFESAPHVTLPLYGSTKTQNPESGNGITETETESIIIQEAVKNIPRYYTLNRRIRYIYYSTRGIQNCGPLLITRIRDIPT